jgi:tRNA/tmRNA/rRNA uracil-C5-methylase (TrmA/RlmC/RlmD family)
MMINYCRRSHVDGLPAVTAFCSMPETWKNASATRLHLEMMHGRLHDIRPASRRRWQATVYRCRPCTVALIHRYSSDNRVQSKQMTRKSYLLSGKICKI